MDIESKQMERLFWRLPYLKMGKHGWAKDFLQEMVRDVSELQHILNQYPETRYEPLDNVYVLLMWLGGLDKALIEHLTQHYHWRGIVLASWLVALEPSETYKPALLIAQEKVDVNKWIVDIALCEIEHQPCSEFLELQKLIQRLRPLLQQVKKLNVKFRLYEPTESSLQRMSVFQKELRECYHKHGVNAAIQMLNSSELKR